MSEKECCNFVWVLHIVQFYGQSKKNSFKPPWAFWFLTQCCLQCLLFIVCKKSKETPHSSMQLFAFSFFFSITIRQTDLEEEAMLYSHPKYPPEDTFIVSFSKRIVQKLDLTLYTVEELSLRFNFSIFPFPQPPTPQAESRVKSTEHLNMLQEQNETERLHFISWRFFVTEVPWETAMDHLFSCIYWTILLQKKNGLQFNTHLLSTQYLLSSCLKYSLF